MIPEALQSCFRAKFRVTIMQCEEIIIPWKQNSFQKNGNQKNGNANGPFIFAQVALRCLLSSQVLTELGHPFDRQTLFAVSVHYKDFLYGYEQVSCEGAVSGSKVKSDRRDGSSTVHLYYIFTSYRLYCTSTYCSTLVHVMP